METETLTTADKMPPEIERDAKVLVQELWELMSQGKLIAVNNDGTMDLEVQSVMINKVYSLKLRMLTHQEQVCGVPRA